MEYGSINRRIKNKHRIENDPRARRSFSTSNLSFKSNCSTSVGRRSLYVTLPKDLGANVGTDGRILSLKKGGPAHSSGVIQLGDFVRVYSRDVDESHPEHGMVTVHVTYGVLQIDSRPPCPLVIKVGNKSNTSLGIALMDTPDKRIKITSVQSGSLADRCGFLLPGDTLTSVEISPIENIPCSPYYTSFQIAQILRRISTTNSTITLTIIPSEETESSDNNSGSTMTLQESPMQQEQSLLRSGPFSRNKLENEAEFGAESNECVLSLCLWKDRLYEDWGFSLIDPEDEPDGMHDSKGAYVHQIRPGGPAFLSGLQPGDRFLQVMTIV
ncbi:unnamed protein product [Allacma fusca]|uniref:PDZ domain-containing protein n=1 Tax=Allacma fusca TaxID=39272 RepID=A0A8J2NTL1_9HEXA|nr:unnamed protein product [Allacma fusca]